MSKSIEIDWSECALVERVPGRCGGRPTVVGTRIEPDSLVADAEGASTAEDIHESFPHLSLATIRGLLDYARIHQLVR